MKKHLLKLGALVSIIGVFLFYNTAYAATAGYTNIGASSFQAGTQNTTNNPTGLLITIPVGGGTVTDIQAYVGMGSGTGSSQNISCKLFNGSAGTVGSLVATTNASTVTTTFGWVTFTFSSGVALSAGTYWLEYEGFGGNGPGSSVGFIHYDTGGVTNTGYDRLDNGTPSFETNQYSIYADYTPSGGGATTSTQPHVLIAGATRVKAPTRIK